MMIATFRDGMVLLGLVALMLVGSAAPVLWAHWTLRGTPKVRNVAIALTGGLVIGLLIGGAAFGLPLVAGAVAAAMVARRHFQHPGRIVTAVLIVVAGLPLWAFTALYALIAIATFGCAPDAYECPL
jgi:predicted metal-binding membrane protein